jgi:pyruvate/2-oxoglutarate/acetoin dehydrogenase E1 component
MTTVLKQLNQALDESMASDERVVLIGEDILDPYGGAFKVTRGLSTRYPEQCYTTPISEAAIVGISTGLALEGFLPVAEIMFGDFSTLVVDQLVNHASKFRWMYNDHVSVPVTIRTPMGGRRGYGPTHSQTLEKLFMGIPGLTILAPSTLSNAGELLKFAIFCIQDPVFFVENKILYTQEYDPTPDEFISSHFDFFPGSPEEFSGAKGCDKIKVELPKTSSLRIDGASETHITIVTYGYMSELAKQAALRLAFDLEIFCEIIVQSSLSKIHLEPVLTSIGSTGNLIVIEEGTRQFGWGNEVIAQVIESNHQKRINVHRVAASDLPVPASSELEQQVLPGVEDIVSAIRSLLSI